MFNIINLLVFLRDNTVGGIIIVLLAMIIYLVKKLGSNHLHHIDMKLDTITDAVSNLGEKFTDLKDGCAAHRERIAKIEGKVGVR